MAYVLIGWIALKLGVETVEQVGEVYHLPWHAGMPAWLFWAGMGLIALFGGLLALRRPAVSEAVAEADARAVRRDLDRG